VLVRARWQAGRVTAVGENNDNDPSVDGVYTVRSSDGGDLKRITNGPDVPIDYSPDGRQIVFGRAAHPNCTTKSALYHQRRRHRFAPNHALRLLRRRRQLVIRREVDRVREKHRPTR
jgi:hypothetical protein